MYTERAESRYLKAAEFIDRCDATFAFVSTSSISEGEQVAHLWSRLYGDGCHIRLAHQGFKWRNNASNNAVVQCVIIGVARTRSRGAFHRATFASERNRSVVLSIDSRTCKFSNKELIEQWRQDRGEDSDFFRVRVLGVRPRAHDSQFIDLDRITEAQKRQVYVLENEPLVAGVDLAWGGEDWNVVRFRRGKDARTIPAIRIPGEPLTTTPVWNRI